MFSIFVILTVQRVVPHLPQYTLSSNCILQNKEFCCGIQRIYLWDSLLPSMVQYLNISQALMNLLSEHPFGSFNCKPFYKWEAEAQS